MRFIFPTLVAATASLGSYSCKSSNETDSAIRSEAVESSASGSHGDFLLDISPDSYPEIDEKFEKFYKGSVETELKWAMDAANEMRKSILKNPATARDGNNNHVMDGPKTYKRAVHPKDHGCVKAAFTVNSEIPEDLQKGIFQPGKVFDAWLRFSNGASNYNQHDALGDARGLAVKVLDVQTDGDKAIIMDNGKSNQDFVMINQKAFIIDNPEGYRHLVASDPALSERLNSFGTVATSVDVPNLT